MTQLQAAVTQRPIVTTTENQLKVIKDKYLKDAPSVEAWLDLVASNIALAEVLHVNGKEERIFAGVDYAIEEHELAGTKMGMILLHDGKAKMNEREKNFKIFMKNLYDLAANDPDCKEVYENAREKFYALMATWEFLPNSPTLMNAGRDLQQLSACYVLPIEDSVEGWMDANKNAAIIHKSGGGTGFSVCRVRPAGDVVRSTKGVASGAMSPLLMIDAMTQQIKQGGQRRGANMGIMPYTHPEIRTFCNFKKTPGQLENFNISVALDKKFMDALEKDGEFDLINPKTKQSVGKMRARELWDEIVRGAWETGDPGVIFIDRINETDSNTTPHVGQIESTNPCVTGDSLIATEKGLVRMAELVKNYSNGGIRIATDNRVPVQIQNKDGTVSLMQTGERGVSFDEITRAFSTGIKDTFKIETKSGYELTATADHKLLVDTEGKPEWIKLDELDLNKHEILVQSGHGLFNQDKSLPFEVHNEFFGENGRRYQFNLPAEWSQELGQAMGFLIGDGWFKDDEHCRVGFTFAENEKKELEYFKPILNKWHGSEIQEVQRGNGVYHLSYHSKYFVDFFKKLGVKAAEAEEKTVPESIFAAPREAVIGFLQGLFTADGTVGIQEINNTKYIRLTSKSEKLLKGVQLLLLNLGMKSRIYDRTRPARRGFNYTTKTGEERDYVLDGRLFELQVSRENIHIFLDEVGFLLNKHDTKVNKLRESNFLKNVFKEKIKSVTPAGKQKVYDLTEPRTLSFITNGLLSLDCGEQPLLPFEPCNLGSINLSKFVAADGLDMDWARLRECVRASVHFLDNVIDVNNYPLPEIERIARGNRRIGLGVMGWAETLVMLELPYNSNDAFTKAEEVMKFIDDTALEMSEELARSRGIFPNWKGSAFDPESKWFRGRALKPRHCARTTIAPTGTIGITAGLQGAGIEPFFAVVYTRYNAKALDAIREGRKPEDKDVFWEINPLFRAIAERNSYFGLEAKTLWEKIDKNHKSLVGIDEIPTEVQNLFLTAHDLAPEDHARMQAGFQKHTNNAVSKTINFANSATIEDVDKAYRLAYELGCKGITIYRDGSKSIQVLNLSDKKTETKKEETPRAVRRKSAQEQSMYYKIDTAHGPLHVHINYDEYGPTRVFANISPSGTEIAGLTTAVAILLSKYFETGGDPVRILRHLNSIKGDRPYGFGPNRVDSIPHALSKAIRDYLVKSGQPVGPSGQTALPAVKEVQTKLATEKPKFQADGGMYCQSCYSNNVAMVSGCSEPTCFDCNYSKCG